MKTNKNRIKRAKDVNSEPNSNDCETFNITVGNDFDQTKYDSCNALVLPSKQSQTKTKQIAKQTIAKTKPISKKKRKKLQRVLDRKKQKLNRNELINDLRKYKLDESEYKLMCSVSELQTIGRKRVNDLKLDLNSNEHALNSLSNINKYKKHKKVKLNKDNDSNVVAINDANNSAEKDTDHTDSSDDSDGSIGSEADNNTCANNVHQTPIKTESVVTVPIKSDQNNLKDQRLTISDISQKNNLKKDIDSEERKKSTFVIVNRSTDIELIRSKLPILSEEHTIMDALYYNSVIVVCGETGSGKTTQLPQFLYEAGYASNGQTIGVTEPRRIAAITMSERVAHEMNLSSEKVSYQIRFEGNVTPKTKIKFMTDGILLKEIQTDFMLTKYSAIIIDEAHERSLYTDILIGLISRIVPLRIKRNIPLKLIIMSATLKVEDFTTNQTLFKTAPPILEIESRQYDVTVHFNKSTPQLYLEEAYNKVCKIHSKSDSGGILVFVTGRKEVEFLCRKLRTKFPYHTNNETHINDKPFINKSKSKIRNKLIGIKQQIINHELPIINLDDYEVNPLETERVFDDFDYSDDERCEADSEYDELVKMKSSYHQPLHCLPLYSMLSQSKQANIFKEPPQGSRLCVIATNVAETSLTIPNIKHVIDCGKVKVKVYDIVSGISTFIIGWTSKASADQRAGRAGRTSDGHCYRLYSSSVFDNEFPKYSEPEIVRKPIDDLVLQMKSMNIENVINFPFITKPEKEALISAEKRLILMGALAETNVTKKLSNGKITPLGKAMASLPICPRYAKMIALSLQHDLMCYTIAIVAALTIQEVFVYNINEESDQIQTKLSLENKKWTENEQLLGDIMVLLKAIGASECASNLDRFCYHNQLRYKAIVESHKLKKQLIFQMNSLLDESHQINNSMKPPNEEQLKFLRQIVLCGFFDHIARKVHISDIKNEDKKSLRNSYQSIEVEKPVFLSPKSLLKDEQPEYVAYQEIYETSKMYMRNVIAIDPKWLPIYVPNLCEFSKPLENPCARYDSMSDSIKCHRSATFGPHCWPIPAVEMNYPHGNDKYKLFAKFLLDGQVIADFKKYNKYLLSPPLIIIKSWASLQPRTGKLVNTLINNDIDCRRKLVKKWSAQQNYLLSEYLDWLPIAYHSQVSSKWPPIENK